MRVWREGWRESLAKKVDQIHLCSERLLREERLKVWLEKLEGTNRHVQGGAAPPGRELKDVIGLHFFFVQCQIRRRPTYLVAPVLLNKQESHSWFLPAWQDIRVTYSSGWPRIASERQKKVTVFFFSELFDSFCGFFLQDRVLKRSCTTVVTFAKEIILQNLSQVGNFDSIGARKFFEWIPDLGLVLPSNDAVMMIIIDDLLSPSPKIANFAVSARKTENLTTIMLRRQFCPVEAELRGRSDCT